MRTTRSRRATNHDAAKAPPMSPDSDRPWRAAGDGAPGDRPMALDGMVSIGPGVDDVVDQVDARGGGTEDPEGGQRVEEVGAVNEDARRRRRHEDQCVLRPLPRTHAGEDVGEDPGGGRRRDRTRPA